MCLDFINIFIYIYTLGFPGGSDGKKSACNVGDPGRIPGWGRSLVKGMATYSSTLWRIPWTEELSGLQSMCVCVSLVAQSYLTLCDSSVLGASPGKNSMESKNQM